MTATIHLLCGSTGAGKTTYARDLAPRIGGVFLSIDAWMATLFWPDAPESADPTWAIARVERCADMIWRTAVDIARAGTDGVLEIGLTTRAARDRYAALAREANVAVRLHLLDATAEERWRRVEARNLTGGELDVAVTRAMFDFVEALWEPPSAEELAGWDVAGVG